MSKFDVLRFYEEKKLLLQEMMEVGGISPPAPTPFLYGSASTGNYRGVT